MITVVTVAPNVEKAKPLATAPTERLRSAASPVHTAAVQGFTVEPVSHMRVRTLPGSHGRLTAIGPRSLLPLVRHRRDRASPAADGAPQSASNEAPTG